MGVRSELRARAVNVKLPLSINNVLYYKITGQYRFQGDLILTTGCIYFFPHTDLDEAKEEVSQALEVVGGPLLEALILKPFVFPLLQTFAVRGLNKSRLQETGVWKPVDSNETLKLKLDGLMAELKRNHVPGALPLPSRFRREEVSNLKLRTTGILSFDAQSDKHDFNVGLFKKGLLHEALWVSGFMKSVQRF
jgi:hypothetical protein